MSKEILLKATLNALAPTIIVCLGFYVHHKINKPKEPTEKLYFEFKKKDSSVTADGFLRYKGKWCPIVLNDSMAVIYQ